MKDLVSIIIPTYNTNESLKNAIDSALNQTYKNIEIIVVDDNNPESKSRKISREIMQKYIKQKNIKYIKHKKNKNGSAARNTGVKYSNGQFISFLDDDDIVYPNKIEEQMSAIINENADFCACEYIKNGKRQRINNKDNYIEDILMNNIVPQTSSFIISKRLFKKLNGFDESYYRHQDYEFLIRICENTKVVMLNKCLYERRDNGVNNIPNPEKMRKLKEKFLKDFEYAIVKYKLNRKKIYSKNYAYVAVLYLKNKNINKTIDIINQQPKLLTSYYIMQIIAAGIINKIRKKK